MDWIGNKGTSINMNGFTSFPDGYICTFGSILATFSTFIQGLEHQSEWFKSPL